MNRGKELMSKTAKTVGITLICLALAGGAIAGGMYLQKSHDEGKIEYPWEKTSQTGSQASDKNADLSAKAPDMETAIKGSGIVLKALTSGVNEQGYATRTFGYTVSPSNATDQRVTVSMSWVDASVTDNVSAFFSWSVDSDAKTITIACKQNFGHQALLTITSQSDSTKYGTVTVDCFKKITGFVASTPFNCAFPTVRAGDYRITASLSNGYLTSTEMIYDDTISGNNPVYEKNYFTGEDFVARYTSVYTKDRDFTFSMTIAAPTSPWTLDVGKNENAAHQSSGGYAGYNRIYDESGLTPSEFYSKTVNFGDSFGYGKTTNLANARAAIQTAIDSLSLDTRDELYDKIGSGTYWSIAVKTSANLTVTCNETDQAQTYPITVFYTDGASNYSFLEPVTDITPEVTGIDF